MKLYRGQIVDTSEDLNGEVWTIAIMNDAEQKPPLWVVGKESLIVWFFFLKRFIFC